MLVPSRTVGAKKARNNRYVSYNQQRIKEQDSDIYNIAVLFFFCKTDSTATHKFYVLLKTSSKNPGFEMIKERSLHFFLKSFDHEKR